jgi:hypothetical protein
MSKPWHNEPTPITDTAADKLKEGLLYQPYDSEEASYVVGVDAAIAVTSEIERRMRSAERLLERVVDYTEGDLPEAEIEAYLKAAKEADNEKMVIK